MQEGYRPCCILSMACPAGEGGYHVLFLVGGYLVLVLAGGRRYPCPWFGYPSPPASTRTKTGYPFGKDLGPETRGTPVGKDLGPETSDPGYPPYPCGQTHTCENSTSPILRLRAVITLGESQRNSSFHLRFIIIIYTAQSGTEQLK